jgi:ferredoxin--NADP+ reductase
LNDTVVYIEVNAPKISLKALPGQFVILLIDEYSERIPFTIAEADPLKGTISIIYQIVGAGTIKLSKLGQGDFLRNITGPLGNASELDGYKHVAVIGGGLGCAIAYPQAKYLHGNGTTVDIIAGFRNKELIILENEMKQNSDNLYICTDDGSNGKKGMVTDLLKEQIESGVQYDLVIAIGPPIMMKFVCLMTKEYNIKTIVSLNPIMVDGTGMCGGCRVTVDNKIKFACIDGPDFDGHSVDFDELMKRNSKYREQENHACNLLKG